MLGDLEDVDLTLTLTVINESFCSFNYSALSLSLLAVLFTYFFTIGGLIILRSSITEILSLSLFGLLCSFGYG
jgi:hypothetical protein